MANSGKVMEAIVKVCGSIDPSLGQAVSDTEGKLGKINVKAAAITAAVGAGIAATAKLTVEAGKYLEGLGEEFDNAYDTIRIGTGATGDALTSLEDDMKAVYENVPAAMEDTSQAIADYNTRLGLTGTDLQDISQQALQVSDMLDEDLGTVIEGSSKAFQVWNIDADNMGDAMDYVFKASQSTGTGFSDLMTNVQKFAPQLQNLGYDFEESVALISQLDKAGVNNTEVLAAMKKSVASLAKEGIGAEKGLQQYSDKIKNAKDMTEATSVASEIFGTRAASTMAAAIRDGSIDVSNFASELSASSETISTAANDTYDFAERLEMFKHQAEVALEPLANTVFDSINDLMPVVSEALTQIMPIIDDLVTDLIPVINEILPQIVDLVLEMLPFATQILTTILPVMLDLLNMIMPILSQAITLVLPIIIQLLQTLMPVITELVNGPIGELLNALLNLMTNAASPLIGVIQILAAMFTGALQGALSSIIPFINSVIGIFTNLINFIMNVFTGNWSAAWQNVVNIFKNIFTAIGSYVKAPINAIITGINSFIAGVNKIKIPSWVPKVGGKSLNIAKIGYLAEGGFTNGPSIAGEVPGQTEAVISFLPSVRDENIALWQKAGEMLGVNTQQQATPLQLAGELINLDNFSLGDMGGTTIIYYDFSGFEYHPEIHNEGNSSEDKNIIDELEENKYEFADWFNNWISLVTQED